MFASASFIFLFYIFYCLILMAYCIIGYIFTSIAIMTMLKKCGHKSPYLAWIPFASIYVYGELAEKYDDKKPQQKIGKSLLTFNILLTASSSLLYSLMVSSVFLRIPALFIGLLAILSCILLIVFTIIYSVKLIIATWRILRIFAPSASVGLLMLCIFVGAQPFVLFAIRNKQPQNLRGQNETDPMMSAFNPYMYQPYPNTMTYPNNNTMYNNPSAQYPVNGQNGVQYPNNDPYTNPYSGPQQNNEQNNGQ